MDKIIIDMKKFTQEDLEDLEVYRQLAIRIKVLLKYVHQNILQARTKAERNEWVKCLDLLDELRCIYDDEMFGDYEQLPDKAVFIFY